MKYVFGVALIFFLSAAHATKQEVEIYVDTAYEPFSYADETGQAKGVYIDILRTAFSRMEGYNVKLTPIPWKRGQRIMEQGKGIGLAPVFYHGHDWPYLYPYSLSFYTETILAICDQQVLKQPRPEWPDDYVGMRISNVAGFDGWGGQAFRRLVDEGKIHYESANGAAQNVMKLLKGRVDCIMMEESAFKILTKQIYALETHDRLKDVNYEVGAVIGTDPVYIGFSKTARESGNWPFLLDFMQSFDSQIYQMIKSGEIRKIFDNYTL
jgi:polar amino acid transport system substrate-binding protein